MLRFHRSLLPDGRARREHFDERKAQAAHLVIQGALDGARRLSNLLVVAQAHALNVSGRLQRGEQFAHVQRIAFGSSVAPVGRGGALLAEERGGSSLAAGHAVNRVVDENHGNVLTAIGGVQNLRRADGREISVALVANDNAFGAAAPDGRGHSGRAPVRRLHVARVEVVVREDRAAHGTDHDGAVLHAQLVDGLRHHLVHNSVAAAGTEVRLMLKLFLPLVARVERFGLAARDLVLRSRSIRRFRLSRRRPVQLR